MAGNFLLTTQLDKDTRISLNILSAFQKSRGFIGIVTTTICPLDPNCVVRTAIRSIIYDSIN